MVPASAAENRPPEKSQDARSVVALYHGIPELAKIGGRRSCAAKSTDVLSAGMGQLNLIDVSAAAETAGVSRQTVYRWIERGLDFGEDYEPGFLTAVRLAGVYYIDPDDLEDFLDARADFYGNDDGNDADDDEG